jgi:hypothetical protein
MPITASIVKKTKIGKGINQILKNKVFDASASVEATILVKKWKKMYKEYRN